MSGHGVGFWMRTTILAATLSAATGFAIAQETTQATATPPSAREQAEALLWGLGGVTKDPAAGVAMLEKAANDGDPAAMRSLGDLLLWGGPVPADPARGAELLAKAAAAGDGQAGLILGKQLVGGWVLPRDVKRGAEMLQAMADKGDPKAQVTLGEFYLYGTGLPRDWDKARPLFEAAAAKGDGEGIWKYGEMLMWSEKDPAEAEAMLTRAGNMGVSQAWASLAEGAMYGYLGGGATSRAKFDGYAAKARAAGNQRIEVLDAIRRMWGISMRADGPKTIEELTAATNAGNREAAHYLVVLLRDGNGLNIRKDRAAAEAVMQAHPDLFSQDERWQYELSIETAKRRDPRGIAESAKAVMARRADITQAGAEQLYDANPNVVIHIIQQDLRKAGLYRGPIDGIAGKRTLRAMTTACKRLDGDFSCADGVLTPAIVGALLRKP